MSELSIEQAARALVARLHAVHDDPKYKSVWGLAQLHDGPYEGPQYVQELEQLEAALVQALPPVAPASGLDLEAIREKLSIPFAPAVLAGTLKRLTQTEAELLGTHIPALLSEVERLRLENVQLNNTIDTLEDSDTLKGIIAGLKDVQEGRTIQLDDVRATLKAGREGTPVEVVKKRSCEGGAMRVRADMRMPWPWLALTGYFIIHSLIQPDRMVIALSYFFLLCSSLYLGAKLEMWQRAAEAIREETTNDPR